MEIKDNDLMVSCGIMEQALIDVCMLAKDSGRADIAKYGLKKLEEAQQAIKEETNE